MRFRLYSIARIVILLAFGVLISLDAPRVQANRPTPWAGLWERINIVAFLVWVVVRRCVPHSCGTREVGRAPRDPRSGSERATCWVTKAGGGGRRSCGKPGLVRARDRRPNSRPRAA
jgi:hypothetical protein